MYYPTFPQNARCSLIAAFVGTGWGRGTKLTQLPCNPVLLANHYATTFGEMSAVPLCPCQPMTPLANHTDVGADVHPWPC
jgi:hypothetical protein